VVGEPVVDLGGLLDDIQLVGEASGEMATGVRKATAWGHTKGVVVVEDSPVRSLADEYLYSCGSASLAPTLL